MIFFSGNYHVKFGHLSGKYHVKYWNFVNFSGKYHKSATVHEFWRHLLPSPPYPTPMPPPGMSWIASRQFHTYSSLPNSTGSDRRLVVCENVSTALVRLRVPVENVRGRLRLRTACIQLPARQTAEIRF